MAGRGTPPGWDSGAPLVASWSASTRHQRTVHAGAQRTRAGTGSTASRAVGGAARSVRCTKPSAAAATSITGWPHIESSPAPALDLERRRPTLRGSFAQAPVDLEADVTTEPDKLVRMRVTSGFPYWVGSTWEWELGDATRAESGTSVLFRHFGFGDGYPEPDLGHTAQTWALILDRLANYAATGTPRPFFPAAPA